MGFKMIELAIYLALIYCGPKDLYCRDYIEDCLLDEGIRQYKFCINDYEEGN